MTDTNSEPERTPQDAVVSPSIKQKTFVQSDKQSSRSGGVARFSITASPRKEYLEENAVPAS
jgi:hypothetical protein